MSKKLNILIIILFLSSCGTLKEGFVNSKKENSDEFLVEKKMPLKKRARFERICHENIYPCLYSFKVRLLLGCLISLIGFKILVKD